MRRYKFGRERFASNTYSDLRNPPLQLLLGVVCAWCTATIRNGSVPFSHSICVSCTRKYFEEAQ